MIKFIERSRAFKNEPIIKLRKILKGEYVILELKSKNIFNRSNIVIELNSETAPLSANSFKNFFLSQGRNVSLIGGTVTLSDELKGVSSIKITGLPIPEEYKSIFQFQKGEAFGQTPIEKSEEEPENVSTETLVKSGDVLKLEKTGGNEYYIALEDTEEAISDAKFVKIGEISNVAGMALIEGLQNYKGQFDSKVNYAYTLRRRITMRIIQFYLIISSIYLIKMHFMPGTNTTPLVNSKQLNSLLNK